MININITNAKALLFKLSSRCIKYNNGIALTKDFKKIKQNQTLRKKSSYAIRIDFLIILYKLYPHLKNY